jgi:outer membrane immunogenic protein
MKIKSSIVIAAAAGSAMAPNAQAADMPVKAQKVTPAPAWTWTGFYAGVHLGYGWQKTSSNGAYVEPTTGFPWSHSADVNGFLGGAQIGYNWQTGIVVFGVEADISGLTGDRQRTTFRPNVGPVTITTVQGIKWFGTVRGRLGVTVTPRTVVYATGGFAYGKVENQHTANEDGPLSFATADKIKTGYAAGGGVEHAILDNITVRVEGLFVDLGSSPSGVARIGACDTQCVPVNFTSDNRVTTVRGGINVRF